MKDHKDLDVWNLSMNFVEIIYKETAAFPKEGMHGLTSQIRRAAISIPSNIAEGAVRQGDKDFVRFLYFALGSAAEVETQILLACRLHFINNIDPILDNVSRIKQMLNGLITFLKSKESKKREV